jgi:hypothetical protein
MRDVPPARSHQTNGDDERAAALLWLRQRLVRRRRRLGRALKHTALNEERRMENDEITLEFSVFRFALSLQPC